jgi:hypothetical protein
MNRYQTRLTMQVLGATALFATAATAVPPEVGPQIRVDTGGMAQANETSISGGDSNPLELVGGWNDYRSNIKSGFALTMDGGKTWTDFLLRPPAPYQSSVEGDPMTCFDPRTGALWAGAISFSGNGGIYVARKDAGSSTFEPSVMARVSGGADKGWMAAGPLPGDPDSTRVYIAYNEGLLWSDDLGDTWSGPRPLQTGLGFLPRIGPNGELYIAYWDWLSGDGVMLLRSFDGGQTFDPPIRMATRLDVWGIDGTRFPGTFRVPPLTYLAVDPIDGTLYCVYFDTTNIVFGSRNVDLYFCRSTDQGSTWTTPTIINDDSDPRRPRHPARVVRHRRRRRPRRRRRHGSGRPRDPARELQRILLLTPVVGRNRNTGPGPSPPRIGAFSCARGRTERDLHIDSDTLATMQRSTLNPIITRQDIPDLPPGVVDVTSVFNPGAIRIGGRYVLLLRVQTRGRESLMMVAQSDDGEHFAVEPRVVEIDGLERVGRPVLHAYDARLTMIDDELFAVFAMDTDDGCKLGVARAG